MKGSIYTNSSIPKPQDSAGYIICQAGTKWKCGVPCSICRKKSFFLSLAVSWLIVMFSVGYTTLCMGIPLWRGQTLRSAPGPCPATRCSRCKSRPSQVQTPHGEEGNSCSWQGMRMQQASNLSWGGRKTRQAHTLWALQASGACSIFSSDFTY